MSKKIGQEIRDALKKQEEERLEKIRLEEERKEKERLEKIRLEEERKEKERLEKIRLEEERKEKERLEKIRLEEERKEKERLERLERLEKQETLSSDLSEIAQAMDKKVTDTFNNITKKTAELEKLNDDPILEIVESLFIESDKNSYDEYHINNEETENNNTTVSYKLHKKMQTCSVEEILELKGYKEICAHAKELDIAVEIINLSCCNTLSKKHEQISENYFNILKKENQARKLRENLSFIEANQLETKLKNREKKELGKAFNENAKTIILILSKSYDECSAGKMEREALKEEIKKKSQPLNEAIRKDLAKKP